MCFGAIFQVAGGCWYILAIQRVASCLQQQCQKNNNCDLMSMACSKEACKLFSLSAGIDEYLSCVNNLTFVGHQNLNACLDAGGPFQYGIYDEALPVISSNSLAVKILYPIYWGLINLRYFAFPPLSQKKCVGKRKAIIIFHCISPYHGLWHSYLTKHYFTYYSFMMLLTEIYRL